MQRQTLLNNYPMKNFLIESVLTLVLETKQKISIINVVKNTLVVGDIVSNFCCVVLNHIQITNHFYHYILRMFYTASQDQIEFVVGIMS